MTCAALAVPAAPDETEFYANGYALNFGPALLLYGPPEIVARMAEDLNENPPGDEPGALPRRVMELIQASGGGVFLPREGLRGQW